LVHQSTGSWLFAAAALAATFLNFVLSPFWEFGYRYNLVGLPIVMVASAGALAAGWSSVPVHWPAVASLAIGALGASGPFAGAILTRAGRRRAPRLEIGRPAPDFTLPASDGSTFRLSEQRGRHVLLCFLVGVWCPVCHVKMRIYQRESARLAARGVKLVLVTGTGAAEAAEFAKALGLGYTMLTDERCEVAGLFGGVQPKRDGSPRAPLPASFLIDPQGLLRAASAPNDLDAFLDPADVLKTLDAAPVAAAPAPDAVGA
jgi:peroxiredoxin